MADDTTADQSSQTPTTDQTPPPNDAASTDSTDGGQDAGQSGGGDIAGDDESSLLGGATAAGTGDGGEDAGATDAEDGDDKGKAAESGPPEAYELKVTTKGDDGNDIEVPIDTVLLEKATPTFKELGLTNEQANKLAPLVIEAQQRFAEQQNDEFTALKTDWAKKAQGDPEIGGAKLKETLHLAGKALDALGYPSQKNDKGEEQNEFRALLNNTVGNHPEMLRAFRKVGALLGEDNQLIRGDSVPRTKKSSEEILYPDDVPTKAK